MARIAKKAPEPLWKPRPWDLLTLAISFAALLVAVTAYFNSAEQAPQGDLEVQITGDPDIVFRKPRFIPTAEQTITLTNGGSRTAVMQSMELVVVDVMEGGTDCDNLTEKTLGAIFIPYDLELITLAAGETATRKVKLRAGPDKPIALDPMFPDTKKQFRILACYRFVAVVASSREITMIEAGTWIFDRNGALISSELNDVSEPQALLSQ